MAGILEYLAEAPVIGVIRGADDASVMGAAAASVAAGMRVIEVTLSRPEACDQIAALSEKYGDDIAVGAGTVLDVESARAALAAGAEFIITPALISEVIEYCREQEAPVFPGAMTPTEIFSAHCMGAEMVKVFPASVLGPGFVKNMRGPFPQIRLMPTGGIRVEDVAAWFAAGAAAIGVGSELYKKDLMAAGDWGAIERAAGQYLAAARGKA